MRLDRFAPLALVAASLLAGCGASARAQGPEPVVVVGDNVKSVKPAEPKLSREEARARIIEEAKKMGLLGALNGSAINTLGEAAAPDLFGGVPGGVVGGVIGSGGSGFGGIGLKGVGLGGGGTGEGIGIGSIGTLSHSGLGYLGASDRVKAKIDSATVEGPLLPDIVQRILGDHRQDMQDCYLLEVGRNVGYPRGQITLVFTIDAKGEVSEVQVSESTFAAPYLQSCIAQTIGAFKFPPPNPAGEVKVTVPVSFYSSSSS